MGNSPFWRRDVLAPVVSSADVLALERFGARPFWRLTVWRRYALVTGRFSTDTTKSLHFHIVHYVVLIYPERS